MSVLAVIAKAPQAGRSKTRLSPPLTPDQAAELAQAALLDTLAALTAAHAPRRVLVLEGPPGPWLPAGIEVIPQRGCGLDERLANAFGDLGGPALIVGMDTPQLEPALLEQGLALLERHDAVLGPADDGGYWAIGLRRPDRRALLGVPMSSEHTLAAQRTRLAQLGLGCVELPPLRDVDTYSDAVHVARSATGSHFGRALQAMSPVPVA